MFISKQENEHLRKKLKKPTVYNLFNDVSMLDKSVVQDEEMILR